MTKGAVHVDSYTCLRSILGLYLLGAEHVSRALVERKSEWSGPEME